MKYTDVPKHIQALWDKNIIAQEGIKIYRNGEM